MDFLLDVDLKMDIPFNVELKNGEVSGIGPRSYKNLTDLPTLDGEIIVGDMHEKDPTVPEWAKSPKKPAYSAEEIGALSKSDIQIVTAADFENMWNEN